MFFADLMLALLVAVALSLVFVAALGWRRPGTDEETGTGAALFFFLILFMATWAGGVWLAPVGVGLGVGYWLPFLAVGLLFALVLAASAPAPEERWRWRHRPRGLEATPTGAAAIESERDRRASAVAAGFGAFFWILLAGLAFVVLLAYVF